MLKFGEKAAHDFKLDSAIISVDVFMLALMFFRFAESSNAVNLWQEQGKKWSRAMK